MYIVCSFLYIVENDRKICAFMLFTNGNMIGGVNGVYYNQSQCENFNINVNSGIVNDYSKWLDYHLV